MTKLLEGKTAIIYGGGGGIGGGVARTYAREGARVYIAGRTREKLDAVAKDITSAGGSVEVDVLDALDERAVNDHFAGVVSKAGQVDVSFNLLTRGDVADVAAFLASDAAAGMTGTMTNMTCGLVLR